mgnify:CR=1 FL=1
MGLTVAPNVSRSIIPHPIANSGKELSLLIQQAAVYISKAMDELEISVKSLLN